MTEPVRPDEDELPLPPSQDPPGVMAWAIAGCTLILAYVAVVILMRAGG